MPLVYKIDILPTLKDKGYSSARLRKEKLLAEATIQNLRGSKPISWANIEKLCEVLECQPGDLLKFVPNSEPTVEEQFCARLSPSVRAGKLNFGKIKNLNPYPGLLWLSQFPKANLIQGDEKEDCVRYKEKMGSQPLHCEPIYHLHSFFIALSNSFSSCLSS